MDSINSRRKDFDNDLENGEIDSNEGASKVAISNVKAQAKTLFGNICGEFVDGFTKSEEGLSLCANVHSMSAENVTIKIVTNMGFEEAEAFDQSEKTMAKEKKKLPGKKKSARPPRPPRGPSLDASDQKLIKEISELAMLKRARIERMRALKKAKATKSLSSNSNVFAMVFTMLFCFVIIFQGMSSKSSPKSYQGSPMSTGLEDGRSISVHYHPSFPSTTLNGHVSASPNLVEQVAGSDPEDNSIKLREEVENVF